MVGRCGELSHVVASKDISSPERDGSPKFVHHFVHALDAKKRVTIPAEFRERIPETNGLYMLPGVPERCLYLYAPREFDIRLEKLQHDARGDRKVRRFLAKLGAWTDFSAWDGQGRIRIKDNLLDYAGIKDHAMLVGAFEMIEVWAPGSWEATNPMDDKELREAAEYAGFF